MVANVEELVRLVVKAEKTPGTKAREKALWDAMTPSERKQTTESIAFVSFADAMGIIADPFDHSNEDHPRPDILLSRNGSDYFFELGELTDENLAKTISHSLKTKVVSGCAVSQVDPLKKMLDQKCRKNYETNDALVDLLLYYWRLHPYEPAVEDYLTENRLEVKRQFLGSNFRTIWIYDMNSKRVLWSIQR